MLSIILWLSLAVLLFIGLPIAISIGGISMAMLMVDGTVSPLSIAQKVVNSVDSFPLMAVPFFVLAGEIMNRSGVTDRIFRFAKSLVGPLPGGLGQVNILASTIMAGMSGSAVSDIAGLGKVEIKAMADAGYEREFAGAVTAASAVIGPIIPPSIPMVLYGSIAGISVMKLLSAGLVPGILLAAIEMAVVGIVAYKRHYPRDGKLSFHLIATTFREGFFALLMPLILLGSVLRGVMTPTECAAFACVYALFIGKFIYKTLSWKDLWNILKKSALFVATTLFVVAMSGVLGQVLTQQNIPQKMLEFFASLTQNKYVILLLVNILLVILGCLMESAAIIVVLAPLLAQIAVSFGIDPIHFGVIVVLNLMISLLTPPVGMGLYLTCKAGNIKFLPLLRELRPFLIALFLVLLLITYVPGIVTFVPNLM